jgi:hypothetical protein
MVRAWNEIYRPLAFSFVASLSLFAGQGKKNTIFTARIVVEIAICDADAGKLCNILKSHWRMGSVFTLCEFIIVHAVQEI